MTQAKAFRLRGGSSIRPSGLYWLIYLVPALAVYIVFMAWPLIDSIRLSFYTGNLANHTYAGLINYRRIFAGGETTIRYFGAFFHTWYFFLIHMLVQNVLGILFAVILASPTLKGRGIYQTIIFLPATLAVLVTGYLWKLLLSPVWSGDLLKSMGLGFLSRAWLGDEPTALTCVSLVSCWQWVGIPTMMFVAAIKGISEELLEAASIEGANAWHTFWHVKLPLIRPVAGIIAILTFVNNFNAFDAVYAMENANGAPDYATDLIGTLFYRVGIAGQHPVAIPDPGMGAAIATLTFFMLSLIVIPTLVKTQRGD